MSKALGAEINYFYNNHFPENHFTDEDEDWIEDYIDERGQLNLPAAEKFELSAFGLLVEEEGDSVRTFSSVFKRWQKKKDIDCVVVQIAKDKRAELIAYLQKGGYTAK